MNPSSQLQGQRRSMITTHGYYKSVLNGARMRTGGSLTRNPRRRRGVTVWAFGASPYEPLERAIQVLVSCCRTHTRELELYGLFILVDCE